MERRNKTCLAATWLIACLGLALGWEASGPRADDAQAATRACAASGSKTLRQTSQVRVYRKRGLVYGCHFQRNRRYVLGGESGELDRRTVQQLRVAGTYAGYTFLIEGREGVSSTVLVKDLRTGSTLRESSRGGGRCCVGTEQARVTDLVLRSNGSIAWIFDITAFGDSPSVPPTRVIEVRKSDRASGRSASVVVDRGPTVDSRSLALRGTTLSWRNAGQLRVAPLR